MEYGAAWCAVGDPGIPLNTSLELSRPNNSRIRSPAIPEPVRPHADLQCRVAQNCGRPLDRVNLRDQGGVDQTCLLEEQVVRPFRVRRLEPVTDRVVLAHEDGGHEFQTEPPAIRAAGLAEQLSVDGDQPIGADLDLSILTRADRLLELGVLP